MSNFFAFGIFFSLTVVIKSMSEEPNQKRVKSEDEEEYDEEADEDFVLEDASKKKDDESDFSEEEEDAINNAKYAKLESETGGLVKTRHQRAQEVEQVKKSAIVSRSSSQNSKSDIDSIWAELNDKGSKGLSSAHAPPVDNEAAVKSEEPKNASQTIKIKRTYEFAGKTVTEEKVVDINSQEAKAHLNSTKLASDKLSEDAGVKKQLPSNLRRKRKRASLLDAVISNSSSAKLSTLEKSRLDWATYVDKNKINEELKYKNKDGYLEKQDFLSRVENKQDQMVRKATKKQ